MLLKGDCIEVMKAMKPNSIDAIVTDPPYGLEFMGKEWDKLTDYHGNPLMSEQEAGKTKLGEQRGGDDPFIAKGIRYSKDMLKMQLWHTQWLTEAYRVLKPGGSMLVMGGTRTSHRLACAIEDTGFIIKDTLMWIYGSGFPKAQGLSTLVDAKILGISTKEVNERREVVSRNPNSRENCDKSNTLYESGTVGKTAYVTKAITSEGKHWDGFKVGGIKPAYEPIIWAVKPPEGSYVDNVLKHGVGFVNVDECRVGLGLGSKKDLRLNAYQHKGHGNTFAQNDKRNLDDLPDMGLHNSKGRFPANIILSHHLECVQVGMKKIKSPGGNGITTAKSHFQRGEIKSGNFYADKDGLETVESWDCHPDCAVRLLDEQSGVLKSGKDNIRRKEGFFIEHGKLGKAGDIQVSYGDNGGASRFYYCAKASRAERNAGLEGMEEIKNHRHYAQDKWSRENMGNCLDNKRKSVKNNHPTVKPIKLFEWLIKLVTREGQIILDPFIGSGTTAIAAHNAGRKCIGIEKEEEYLEIAKRRATHWRSRPKQLEMTGG